MKCQKCNSQMFVIDENVSARSQVTFYRCSLCVNEHVSSEPVVDTPTLQAADLLGLPLAEIPRPLMV